MTPLYGYADARPKCPRCDSKDARLVGESGQFVCQKCGFAFTTQGDIYDPRAVPER